MWPGSRGGWPATGSATSARGRVSRSARPGDYGIVEEYTGHGIGTEMHMEPVVRNYGRRARARGSSRAWRWRSSR